MAQKRQRPGDVGTGFFASRRGGVYQANTHNLRTYISGPCLLAFVVRHPEQPRMIFLPIERADMSEQAQPTDLELAALISSKICHDVIGPVGAIYNGLEILDEDEGAESNSYALDVIRNVTEQASARLQFARFAFGAAGSAGAMIDLGTAEQISRGFIDKSKHTLNWHGLPGHMAKDKVKLLLNLLAAATTALPRGGEIDVLMGGSIEEPSFVIRCRGKAARPPQYLTDFVAGENQPVLDALSIQAYYTWRLAGSAQMRLEILKDGADILLSAKPFA
jgi:histidine phosphotransferase ChpT